MTRMKAASPRQTAFGTMIGHSRFMIPKASQSAKPTTVTAYIRAEMPSVSRVRMIFQACGVKLVMEQSAASEPTIVTMFMGS